MTTPRLNKAPEIEIESLADLVGIASAIEHEAAERYAWLANEMRRRGELDTAEVFDRLGAEEKRHIAAVDDWTRMLNEAPPSALSFSWRLPADIPQGWEDAAKSAKLTPYRAYAIAADNEERAFAFFAYLAASTDDPQIAEQAEWLAQEELRHAARIRVWRRAAWHRERVNKAASMPDSATSPAELQALVARREAEIAACHDDIAQRLTAVDAHEAAVLLRRIAAEARDRSGAMAIADQPPPTAHDTRDPAALLEAAQRPLEQLCELLEAIAGSTGNEATQKEALDAMEAAVSRLARIGYLHERMPQP